MDALSQTNAIMEGVAQYMAWRRKFLSDWQEGILKGNLKQAYAMMPPELKEMMKKTDPKGYEMVTTMLKGD